MPSITIRGLDERVLERVRSLAQLERRSVNGELLVLIDRALQGERGPQSQAAAAAVPKETQLQIWRRIAGWWEDDRSTDQIITDIYERRTLGREISL